VFDPLMGVIGTSCQLCKLPLNHDHYVTSPSLGLLKIYRTSADAGGHDWQPDERVVHFAPEHAWLCDAVAMSRIDGSVVAGVVEDGGLDERNGEGLFVGSGDDDGFAFHRYCYELTGSPTTLDTLVTSHHSHGWALLETYNGQLFDLRALVDHGKAWMLVDPHGDSPDARRSRARIAAILAQARTPMPQQRLAKVADVLAADRGWCARMIRNGREPGVLLRYRDDVHPELDCADYPALVWAMKEFGEGFPDNATLAELELFELAVKTAVEADAGAILLMVTIGDGQAQYIIQARDEAVTRAKIAALPQGEITLDFDNERDPTWKVFFTQLAPRRRAQL
jgi:hypothetical protein